MSKQQLDAFLVTNFSNILYLTGCKTLSPHEREAYVLVTKNHVYFFTDGRYEIDIRGQIDRLQNHVIFRLISLHSKLLDQLNDIIATENIQQLGFEGTDLTVDEFKAFKKRLLTVEMIATNKSIMQQRIIKDATELDLIRKTCAITDTCLSEVIKTIRIGMKEKELAYLFEKWIREHGYDMAFDPMVAFDASGALPHYDAKHGERRLQQSSVILIDFGIKCEDYVSDISRMFFMGEPTAELQKVYEGLLYAQEKTIAAIGHEAKTLQDINQFCRQYIAEAELPDFSHAVGHGVGLEVHELPVISARSIDEISPQSVFTIEPGVYIAGKYGMRIEDTVAIRADGTAEVLTKFPKEMIVL